MVSPGTSSNFLCTGDQHQPKICQSPHPKGRVYVIEGPLQRNNQVTGQRKASVLPPIVLRCNTIDWTCSDRKEDVRATEKDKVCFNLLGIISAARSCLTKIGFFVAGGDLQKLQAWWHCPGKSCILNPQSRTQDLVEWIKWVLKISPVFLMK